MRRVGVVTVGRSDFGIYRPVLRQILAHTDLELVLLVSGMHLSPEFGRTIDEIESEGFEVAHQVEMLVSSDTPEAIAKSIGLGVIGFSQVYAGADLDLLVVLGDRFEMLAAAIASVPFALPMAHVHGGESTEGLIDEPIRHSLTKMSHLHFVSTTDYSRRVVQMGEEPWRVSVSGAPSLDNLAELELMSREELEQDLGVDLSGSTALLTYHPVTLELSQTAERCRRFLDGVERSGVDAIFTCPNADTTGRVVIDLIEAFVARNERHHLIANLGTHRYFSLMNHVALMVGNSSSGIIEAASFGLPVVNVGIRQQGRVRGPNVIDVEEDEVQVARGITAALQPSFREGVKGLPNPYGNGTASQDIVERLATVELGSQLLIKKFRDQST